MDKLKQYRRKRDFNRTREPRGGVPPAPDRNRRFVVQKHAARRLHYDLRLELDGVLKSWAVPKGPSLDPTVRRLAVETEDHPLEYAEFEGLIPPGEYGAGSVIVWDSGTWRCSGEPLEEFRKGKLTVNLEGRKLHGNWALVRKREGAESEDERSWFLIKVDDETAERGSGDRLLEERPLSVLSGRSIEELRAASSNGADRSAQSISGKVNRKARLKKLGAEKAAIPDFVAPQLAAKVDVLPSGDSWIHELKIDGYRIIARLDSDSISLLTRNRLHWQSRYPSVVQALRSLPVQSALLDGEVAVTLADGTTSFQALQQYDLGRRNEGVLQYYIFDILHLDGFDLRKLPLVERKKLLRDLLADQPGETLRYSDDFQGDVAEFFSAACSSGAEGVISKKRDAAYRSGRSSVWQKRRCTNSQEFVVGGMTRMKGVETLGALLLGVYPDDGALRYVGKVGTGFTERVRKQLFLKLRKQEQKVSPFLVSPRGMQAIWLAPTLAAEVEFTEWTGDGKIRHPVFKGLREDKNVKEVTLESPVDSSDKTEKTTTARRRKKLQTDISLSSPERIVYPEAEITKGQIFDYYRIVAPLMLPEARMRPLTLLRCPEGIAGNCFYQRHSALGIPEEIPRVTATEKGSAAQFLTISSVEHILQLVQLNALEFHAWNIRGDKPDTPDRLVFDLDPDPALQPKAVIEGALLLKEALDHLGLSAYVRLTGGKGLHVVCPLIPRASWQDVRRFAEALAKMLAKADPGLFVAVMTKTKRKEKIYLDYLRNNRGASAILNYSTRARPGATVAAPIRWEELPARFTGGNYNITTLQRRIAALKRDPWEGFDTSAKELTPTMLKAVGL